MIGFFFRLSTVFDIPFFKDSFASKIFRPNRNKLLRAPPRPLAVTLPDAIGAGGSPSANEVPCSPCGCTHAADLDVIMASEGATAHRVSEVISASPPRVLPALPRPALPSASGVLWDPSFNFSSANVNRVISFDLRPNKLVDNLLPFSFLIFFSHPIRDLISMSESSIVLSCGIFISRLESLSASRLLFNREAIAASSMEEERKSPIVCARGRIRTVMGESSFNGAKIS